MGKLEFIKSATDTNVTSLEVTDCFTADYEVYYATLDFVRSGTNATQANLLTFLDSTNTNITANYGYASLQQNWASTYSERRDNAHSDITWVTYDNIGSWGGWIINPYNSAAYTYVNSGGTGDTYHWAGSGTHQSAETLKGIKFTFNGTGQYDSITIKVWGVK